MESRPGTDRSEDLGGDPVCWLNRVCPECGRFAEGEDLDACPECGVDLP
ncbi:MAG TPA: hypothetical protein VH008_02280 [Pseudonocardia sp.]|nr:hypothetical protein [Pseudonocardia sp.]